MKIRQSRPRVPAVHTRHIQRAPFNLNVSRCITYFYVETFCIYKFVCVCVWKLRFACHAWHNSRSVCASGRLADRECRCFEVGASSDSAHASPTGGSSASSPPVPRHRHADLNKFMSTKSGARQKVVRKLITLSGSTHSFGPLRRARRLPTCLPLRPPPKRPLVFF